MMHTLFQDVRYALRQLSRSPGFTITAVLILALGIGANAAIFTLVHAVLLRNLPVANPNMLVRLGDSQDCCVRGGMPNDDDFSLFPYDLYKHLQARTTDFEQLAAVQSATWKMTVRGSKPDAVAQGLSSEFVSGNYFQTLGLMPFAGRLLSPADDQPNAAPVAVISYQAWQRDYALDRSIIGSTFFFKTHPVTIVGVTPPGYYGDRLSAAPANFYLPFALEPTLTQPSLLHAKTESWVYILGRVKPGTALGPLQAKLSGMVRQWLLANDEKYQKQDASKHVAATHVILTPGGAGITTMQHAYARGLRILMSISALVLLIACANLANLMLVRATGRATETSLRMALGAQGSRILRQMLTESIVLSTLGGLAGLAVAYLGTKMLLALAFPDSPALPIQASPSFVVLIFAFSLSLLTGVLFGIAPAWIASRAQPADALRGSNRATQGKASFLQRSLVVLQAALSLVLLIGAGLFSKSLGKLEHQDLGLQTANRIVIHIDPESAGYKPGQFDGLYREIDARLGAIPGVQKVALASYSPLGDDLWGDGVVIQGKPRPGPDADTFAAWARVSPKMFDLIGQRVLRGRGITAQDIPSAPGVAVVNQAFVKKFFKPGEDPVGSHFGTGEMNSAGDFMIVGVVNDVNWVDPREPVTPMFFLPLLQLAASDPSGDTRGLHVSTIMLQTAGPIDGLESQVRRALASINANLPVDQYQSFEDQIALQFVQDRLVARLTMLFSGLSLVLASIGLYGVTSYTVAHRTSEIGIRMALGADRRSVLGLVLREAMQQAALGLALGLPVALLCVRFIKTQLYGVEGHDPIILLAAMVALLLSATIAALIPARRAATIDPMQALRTE
jgi:predicted permease